MSQKMHYLGDPEPAAVSENGVWATTPHGAQVARDEIAKDFGEKLLALLRQTLVDDFRISEMEVVVYSTPNELTRSMHVLPYIGYKITYKLSTPQEDGTWGKAFKYVIGG